VWRHAGKFACCVLSKALNGIASTFEWLDFSNRWQLDSKNKKVPSPYPGRGSCQINEYLNPGYKTHLIMKI